MRKILTSVGLLILGGSLGYLTQRIRNPTPMTQPPKNAVSNTEELRSHRDDAERSNQRVTNVSPLTEQSALRTAVREELTQILDERAKASATANQTQEAEENLEATPSPRNIAAYDRGKSTLETAIRSGRWTETERTQLQDALTAMTSDMREDLMHTVIIAANEGRIKVETRGPLF